MREDDGPADSQARERLFDDAVLHYLEAKASGEVRQDEFLVRYAGVAAELAEFFAAEEQVGSALSPPSTLEPAATPGGRPPPPPPADAPPPFGKYADFAFVSRGGMGAVYRCRDVELGRPLALKVMHPHLARDPERVRDFREEARVAGRLIHPNIAPVHELGTLPDGRPYFAMKLVQAEGRTLADLIRAQHAAPTAAGFDGLLRVFVAVGHAVAYAHAHGVLHRDLKPANVMIGAHGEVQVMDWGLSTVVSPAGGRADSGVIRGTFAYMPPEQAEPGPAAPDPRGDVFALGALLCEILTGTPPYTTAQTDPSVRSRELWRAAAACATGPAFARLDASGAPVELAALAKRGLARDPADRPAGAAAVADGVTAYLAGVQEKLHAEAVGRARAESRAVEERKRRRWQLGLAATLVAALAGAAAVALWFQHDRSVRAIEHSQRASRTESEVAVALDEAVTLFRQAKALAADPARQEAALAEALSAVRRAEGVRANGVDDSGDLRRRIDALRLELEAAETDRRMIAAVEEARLQAAAAGAGGFDLEGAAARYAAAFQADLGLSELAEDEAARRINARPIREELLDALDRWADTTPDESLKRRLHGIVQAADADPTSVRNRRRALLERKDWPGLRQVASGVGGRGLSASEAAALAEHLLAAGVPTEAEWHLRAANDAHPGDFWVLLDLGNALTVSRTAATLDAKDRGFYCLWHYPDEAMPSAGAWDEAIVCYTAAAALRPNSVVAANNVGLGLANQRLYDDAITAFRRAIALRRDYALPHTNLGLLLAQKGLRDKDPRLLDDAVAECREATELDPMSALAFNNLGHPLYYKHQLDDAKRAFHKAAQLDPHFALADYNLGVVLLDQGLNAEAIAAFRRALASRPDFGEAHGDLAAALYEAGPLDQAAAECREALRINPDDYKAHSNLGLALGDKGQTDEAVKECRLAVQLAPGVGMVHTNLAAVLCQAGSPDEAIAECREALKRDPDDYRAHSNLGLALADKHRPDDAIAEYRKALAIQPDAAKVHDNLGNALSDKGQAKEAVAEYRKAILIDPGLAGAHANLAIALQRQGQLRDAIDEGRKAVALEPNLAEAHFNLGQALQDDGQGDEAMAEWQKAAGLKPEMAAAHFNLARGLQGRGQLAEAVAEYHKTIEASPAYADAYYNLACALMDKDQLEDAIAAYRQAIRLKPDDADAVAGLAYALYKRGSTDEAMAAFRKAIALDPNKEWAHYHFARALAEAGLLDEAVAEYRRAIELKPDHGAAFGGLGSALRRLGRLSESLAAYRRSYELAAQDGGAGHSAERLREAVELVRLESLLPMLLRGAAEPASPAAALRFAAVCGCKRRYATAVRLYAEAFAREPALAGDNRYDAACCAALAGCGRGDDAAASDPAARIRWREQARDWLRADLSVWAGKVEGTPKGRGEAVKELAHWRRDADLAGVRDTDALAGLPPGERDAWLKLWADVDALLSQLAAKK